MVIDINKDPLGFLQLMVGFMFSDLSRLGYDQSITSHQNGHREVIVRNPYVIVKTLFSSGGLRGRGTICWHGWRNGNHYAIKDSWPNASRLHFESKFLEKADGCGIKGVPRVVEKTHVLVNGLRDATDRQRQTLGKRDNNVTHKGYINVENRMHSRMVLEPFAVPLTHFASKRELLMALMDIIRGNWYLIISSPPAYIVPSLYSSSAIS